MRKLRVRTYFLIGLVLLSLLPWVFFVAAHLMTIQSLDFREGRPHTVPLFTAFIGLLLAVFIIGIQMQRLLLLPLERLSQVSRQIAEGDWDVQLPRAAIREIAEVRDGFEIMLNGIQSSHKKQAMLEEERRFVIAAVAHDLRTPLFALRGYLDGLEQGIAQSPDKMTKYVSVCKEKATQLDRLVEDLFTFTKAEYIKTERINYMVDLSRVLKRSIVGLTLQAQKKNISIVERDFKNDCMVIGDSHLLERTMNNLLDNAVRHTPMNGKIVVECYKQNDNVTFTIKDSGKGFSLDEITHVFEPLYRGEVSRNRSTGGAGLGLTISQRIIRQHGGDLTVGNHSDGGALLEGWIPLANNPLS